MLHQEFPRSRRVRAHEGYDRAACRPKPPSQVAECKALQTRKIKEISASLFASGLITLDDQARALGLSRSTTWAVLKASHKASGLSAATINRVLRSSELPQRVRATILTYVEEKMAGLYGHNKMQLRRFAQCFYYLSDHAALLSNHQP